MNLRLMAGGLVLLVGLTGCSAVFDGNAFSSIDTPPPLDSAKLAAASVSDLNKQLSPTLYNQLKADPTSMAAVKTKLAAVFGPTSTASAADKAQAAQVYIQVMANATDAMPVVNNFMSAILPLASGKTTGTSFSNLGTDPTALQSTAKSLFSGQSQAQISTTLQSFSDISAAMTALQTASTSGTTTDTSLFFGTHQGSLVQIGLVATVTTALVNSAVGANTAAKADVVASLVTSSSPATIVNDPAQFNTTTLGNQLTEITNAITKTPSTLSTYSYLPTLTATLTKP